MRVHRGRPAALGVTCVTLTSLLLTACGSQPGGAPASTSGPSTSALASPATSQRAAPTPTTDSTPSASSSAPSRARSHTPSHSVPATRPTRSATSHSGTSRLPLRSGTGDATQVITVVARSDSSTTAQVQAWRKSGSRWLRVGPSVQGNLGSAGLSAHASESSSATPIGSFTLTQAFGAHADPGTSLPYRHTDPGDWWISQSGPLYNTRQHCTSDCGFTRGAPNEHLYYETPAYDYAVVIDYNTRNAPDGVRQGAGSAFFLHVSEGMPTAGCVSVPRASLLRLLRWLDPQRHPRILIGT